MCARHVDRDALRHVEMLGAPRAMSAFMILINGGIDILKNLRGVTRRDGKEERCALTAFLDSCLLVGDACFFL